MKGGFGETLLGSIASYWCMSNPCKPAKPVRKIGKNQNYIVGMEAALLS